MSHVPKTWTKNARAMKISTIFARYFFLLTAVSLSSCTKTPPSSTSEKQPRWFRWAMPRLPEIGDWRKCQSRECETLARLIARGPSRLEINDGAWIVTPDLVTWKSISASEWEITIREATWSDGTRVLRDQLVSSWREVLKDCKQFPRADLLLPIAGGRSFCEGKTSFESVGIKLSGSTGIRVRLERPLPAFPRRLAHPVAWPYRKEAPGAGLGPFTLQSIAPDRIRLVKSAGSGSMWDGVELTAVPSSEGRLQTFLEHSAEMVDDLSETVGAQVRNYAAARAVPTTELTVLILPPSRRPFHQLPLRQLLKSTMDRKEIVELMRWPHFPTNRLLGLPVGVPTPTSPAKARETLASLKLDLGPWLAERDERAGKPNLSTLSPNEIARNLEAQWKKSLGLSLEVLPQAPQTPLLPRTAYLLSLHSDPYDATRLLENLLTTAKAQAPALQTRSLEAWLASASLARTPEALEQALDGAERWLLEEESFVIPLHVSGKLLLHVSPPMPPLQNPIEFWEFWNTTSG